MSRLILPILVSLITLTSGCDKVLNPNLAQSAGDIPFTWNNANVYFLLTDRFNNGDPSNDFNYNRTLPTARNRGFKGGDIKGITQKIKEGYFTDLGISAIWLTPFFDQIKGIVDEGTGETYAYHGYWTSDWTALDPNFGTEEELMELVKTAYENNIRIVMDIIVNHTGPVTPKDPVWPNEWVRTSPQCSYENYETTIECTLVENLPDIKTESEDNVDLPPMLLEKWKKEQRLEKELKELDAFFEETGYPRAPKYYIIKWLTDYIKKYGISAYRIDTAKHTEEDVWAVLRREADKAYRQWKAENPDKKPLNESFYMVGEVYNYVASSGRNFNFGDTVVDFYAEGIDHLINFEFKSDANNGYEEIFSKYSNILHNELAGNGFMNYISSHDDGWPLDKYRENPMESATKLLLCPGAVQIYYGDESSRILTTEGANGDANLRSFMNWDEITENKEISGFKVQNVLTHYQKLGKFRNAHPAVGAGKHEMISAEPYVFKRTYQHDDIRDVVVIALKQTSGVKTFPIGGAFNEGTVLKDSYSGMTAEVIDGFVSIDSPFKIVLLGLF